MPTYNGTNNSNNVTAQSAGNWNMYGNGGNDTLRSYNSSTGYADNMYGGTGDDRLYAYAGNDDLYGNENNDDLYGGNGNDRLYGGSGNDDLFGGLGDDRLYGESGADRFFFEVLGGSDTVYALGSSDLFYIDKRTGIDSTNELSLSQFSNGTRINLGNDGSIFVDGVSSSSLTSSFFRFYFNGSSGSEQINGDASRDVLSGAGGDDQIRGLGNNDTLYGGANNDLLVGGSGDDYLYGDSGVDYLYGDSGRDNYTGGTGADRFYFSTGAGGNEVRDFNDSADDRIYINHSTGYTYNTLIRTAGDYDGDGNQDDTRLSLGGSNYIDVWNIAPNALGTTDIIFY